jgi:hypothetical protein
MPRSFLGLVCAPVAILLLTASPAVCYRGKHSGNASVRVDCSAFRRTSPTSWVVTKETIVPPGVSAYVEGQLDLPTGATIGPHLYWTHGADLTDVLARRCGG